ncbi:MAG: transglycosylase SLT domain-containing protein [Anaerolineae bacterium]
MPRSHLIRMLLILTAVSLVMAGLVSLKPSPAAAAANGAGNELIAETALSEQTQASGLDTAVISPVFTPEVQHWTAEIGQWAAEFGLDPNLVATIMQIESCGDPTAVSPAGAQGLFQVMPFHFGAGEEMQNPTTNARRGLAYFVERLAQTDGDTRQSFAGYNGGHVAAAAGWNSWLPETRAYVRWATGIYDEALAGKEVSETLAQWQAAGGDHLCDRATAVLGLAD